MQVGPYHSWTYNPLKAYILTSQALHVPGRHSFNNLVCTSAAVWVMTQIADSRPEVSFTKQPTNISGPKTLENVPFPLCKLQYASF